MNDPRFTLVGARPAPAAPAVKKAPWSRGRPGGSAAVLLLILLG